MKKSFIAAVALSAILGFTSTAFAAIYDNGTGTTDSTSGLDWLDLTASTGRSYADVSGEFGTGGDFEGYRYATTRMSET